MWDDVRLVCFPAGDSAFEERVRALVTERRGKTAAEAELLAAVLEDLRRDYPDVRIRSRDPIADYWPEQVTWYVYRDGRQSADEPTVGKPGT